MQREAESFQEGFSKSIWPLAMQLKNALAQNEQSKAEDEEKMKEAADTNINNGNELKSTGEQQSEVTSLSKVVAPQKTELARRRKHGNKS